MIQSQSDDNEIRLTVVFFRTQRGSEPVREWLKSLPADEKRILGEDIKTAQFGWLGQWYGPGARRANVTGWLKAPVPVMWNVEKK